MTLRRGEGWSHVDLFGGRGEVQVWSLMERVSGPFTAVLSCELAPGGSVGRHRQQECPEVVIGLEGSGRATVNGAPQPLEPGAVVYLPFGAILALENLSAAEPLRYLIIKAREVADAPDAP